VDATGLGLPDSEDNVQAVGTIANADITTIQGANILIESVDSALDQINAIRGDLGAVQNRFESTIRKLSSISESLSAANSRILDADFAAETANLTKNQVLQQAGISVLAQANALPQQVLSLLQG
jgi:flagellin